MSELLIDSATDKSETNSPIKMTHQEDKDEVVYLSRTRKKTISSKMMIKKINDMKIKLGSSLLMRKSGKRKIDPEPPAKTAHSAKRKQQKDAFDMGRGDDRLPETSKVMTDVAMVSLFLMAGWRSASY